MAWPAFGSWEALYLELVMNEKPVAVIMPTVCGELPPLIDRDPGDENDHGRR